MTDTSTADELPPQTNGVASDLDDEERARMRPADIDADVREMERRKRVELIMNSKLFREELERIIETQLKDGTGASGLLQQISDMVGVNKQAGNVFKNSSCVIPINDIRGIESMGYAKGEKILRCKLAAVFRLIDLYGWTQGANTLITARLNQEEEQFLVNPYGMLFHEITASSLIKVDMQGGVIEQGTTNFSVNVTAFSLHAAVHAARPDIRCIVHIHTPSVVAVSALKHGLLPLSQESVVIGEVSTHQFMGGWLDADEKDKLARNLGPINKVLLLSNQGALCCGETIEETFFNARNTVLASESQLKLLPVGLDNLVLLNDEARKKIYDASHKAPESTPRPDQPSILEGKVERKWRVGGIEFEALMRMMDNAGFRTGYIYRHPLVKGEPPKPRNDVEVPPAVSSLGYLLEEEELYRQGLWKKLEGGRKGHDRSRWLNSPNVYQKVEILETGTPDPKKITKWVTDGSPSHSTPVRIETALQFVPQGTNPKEFKARQQQIKDYRRADKISAGPQSHILEGVTWEEARKMQDAAVTQTGDQVVLMGAASKGIIQRGHQHNATVYKSPYAKNPFDSVTDEELEDYKKVVEKKAKGEYDTDYSESDGLSSAHINKRMDSLHLRSPTSVTSETEEESRDEPQILRIETRTVPKASQPEVVLSDVETSPVEQFLRAERTSVNSHKNYEELPFDMINPQDSKSYYRSNSHAGFPKGSYIIPNPVHYHIARQTQIAKAMRPTIVSLLPHNKTKSYFKFNDFNRQSHNIKNNSVITLSLKDAHSVALDISLDSLKAFIHPFAKALNLVEIPLLNNQGSQTSYVTNFNDSRFSRRQRNNVEYTPLFVDQYSNTLHTSDRSTSFEQRILNDLQRNLVEQFIDSNSKDEGSENGLNETVEFTERDQVEANESLAEISPDLAVALPGSSSSKSSGSGKTYNVEELKLNGEEYVALNRELDENDEDELAVRDEDDASIVAGMASMYLDDSSDRSSNDVKACKVENSNPNSEEYEPIYSEGGTNGEDEVSVQNNNKANFITVYCEDGSDESSNGLKTYNVEFPNPNCEEDVPIISEGGENDEDASRVKENYQASFGTAGAPIYPKDNFSRDSNGEKMYHLEEIDFTAEKYVPLNKHEQNGENVYEPKITWEIVPNAHLKPEYKSLVKAALDLEKVTHPNDKCVNHTVVLIKYEDTGVVEEHVVLDFIPKAKLTEPYKDDATEWVVNQVPEIDLGLNVGKAEYYLTEDGRTLFILKANPDVPPDTEDGSGIKHNTSLVTNENDSFCEKGTNYTEDIIRKDPDESGDHSVLATNANGEKTAEYTEKVESEIVEELCGKTTHNVENINENILNVSVGHSVIPANEDALVCEQAIDHPENLSKDVQNESLGHSIVEIADKFSSEFLKVVDDYEVAMDVINQVKQILNGSQNGKSSVDEGIEDPSVTITTGTANSFVDLIPNVDERVTKLGTVLRDYIIDEGFEIKELLVFPELLNDQNTSKLLSKLITLYKELYNHPISAEDKNELRLSIANYVLNLLTVDDRFKNDSSDSDNLLNISDKIFTISEYISEVLDKFFEVIGNEEFSDFAKDMSDQSCPQSTPDKRPTGKDSKSIEVPDETYTDNLVMSFKKDSKVASESFWISISPMPTNTRQIPAKRAIINVDDIPLRPPEDLYNDDDDSNDVNCRPLNDASFKCNVDDIPLKPPKDLEESRNKILLSPIREESKVNLFDSQLSPDYEILNDTSSSLHYEVIDSDESNVGTEKCLSSERSYRVESSEVEASDSSAEINIVVCNEIEFFRTNFDNPPFAQRSNVVFTTDVVVKDGSDKNDENKENEPLNDSGDWMGYERAKF